MLATKCWAVVPAAGIGSRMRADLPKQYLKLGQKSVIEYSIGTLLAHPSIEGVVVALQAQDTFWPQLQWQHHKTIITTNGGAERVNSVLNGLAALHGKVRDDHWILVHDAARPCVAIDDISRLINSVLAAKVCGGLLAMPVRDTMKRGDADRRIVETVARESLWHAQTPQMFRYRELIDALQSAMQNGVSVTDECSAFEHLGEKPLLVECGAHNLKITHAEDLRVAESYLRWQGSDAGG